MIDSSGLKLYGIIGHPIGHSLSPLMHNASFEALGIHATMQAYDIPPQSLHDALESFVKLGFGGINVTIPHKQAILPYLSYVDEEASIIGAVNTVKFEGSILRGSNTDAYGFLKALDPVRSSIEGAQFLLLGAGGAARAVAYVLLKSFRASQIIVVSRSLANAKALAEHFRAFHSSTLGATSFDDPQIQRIVDHSGVIINATPVGMHPNPPELVVDLPESMEGRTVVDLIYHPIQTEILRVAAQRGARTISGVEMFLHQGARAFELWTGHEMDIELARKLVTDKLNQDSGSASASQ